MNKTQKGAWFALVTAILLLAFSIEVAIGIFHQSLITTGSRRFISMLMYFSMLISCFFLRKKQSPTEPDFDERDSNIRKNAVLVSFISVWILLVTAIVITLFVVGEGGLISVDFLPIACFGLFLAVAIIYSSTVLVQYGRGGKDG